MFTPITSLIPGNSPMREGEPILNGEERTEAQKISKIALGYTMILKTTTQFIQFPSLVHFPISIKMEANQAIYFYFKNQFTKISPI